MNTSDLKAAIRVAQSACQTAEKEAVYAQHTLAENDDDVEAAAAAEYNISTALSLLDIAMRQCRKEES
jgi:hypothetical protein